MNLDAIARFAATGILNSLLAGTGIAMLAWVVTRTFRRQGSRTRFAVWFLALIAVGMLPFVGNFARSSHAAAKMSSSSALTLPQSFATYLFVAWMIGAILGLLHVAHGLYRLRRLRATCTPVDLDQLDATSRAILANVDAPSLSLSVGDRVGIHRRVTLCTSEAVRVPAAIGYFRPLVVFPTWARSELSAADLNAILLHELAHLRRWDDFTNLAQKIAKAIFFFHPAVWFIESRLTLEREMACDDAVLAASFSPRAYAESLVDLAEKSFLRRGVQLAQAAVSHVQQLKLRLAEILRKDRSQQGSGVWKPAVVLMSLVGIICSYCIAHTPRLVVFSSDTQQIASRYADNTVAPVASAARVELAFRLAANPALVDLSQRTSVRVDRSLSTTRLTSKSGVSRCWHLAVLPPPVNLTQRAYIARVNAELSDAPPPVMLLSRLPKELIPAPVLVVFQGQQFGPDGPIFWHVTIVHMTPAQQRAITGQIAKQI
jgi:beta-lactamase regulating signal transducer with metallopeptidase domain